MFKNVAAKFIVFAFDATTNVPKTGDAAQITAYVSKDYGTVTVLGDTSATEMDATNAPGYYLFDAAQGETNADVLMVSGKSSTANIKIIGAPAVIFTRPTTGWLAPATAGRTLNVDASGRALADVDTIKTNPVVNAGTVTFPTTATLASTTNITGGTITTVTTTATATNLTNLPSIPANWLTAAGINTGAITSAKFAAGAIDAAAIAADAIGASELAADAVTEIQAAVAAGAVASVTGAVGSVTGAVGSVTGNVGGNVTGSVGSVAAGGIAASSFAAGAIDATAIATNAIDADALAADAVTEIWAKAMSDLAAVPAINASALAALNWLFVLARNQIEQTATTTTVRKDDAATSVATSTVSDNGTTFTRGEFA